MAHCLAAQWPSVSPQLTLVLRRGFAGLGRTKLVEDGVKVVREAEDAAPDKKVGPRRKWLAL
eukprot:5489043-Lingulodinium_polyedra.AAC.1